MYIRCDACGASTRVPFEQMIHSSVNCTSCGNVQSTMGAGVLGLSPEERSERAQSYAAEHDIDLATAYSVLLGNMPLERAPVLNGDDPAEFSATHRHATGEESYDLAFHDAVASGLLTAQQAVARGDRVTYASRFARRHGLSMNLAFQVADNRLSVHEALRRKALPVEPRPQPHIAGQPAVSRTGLAWVVIVFVCICGGVGWRVVIERGKGPEAAPKTAAVQSKLSSESEENTRAAAGPIRVNSVGQPLMIRARDPEQVLRAYCSASTGPVFGTPERVVRSGDDYIGYLSKAGIHYGIRIRKEKDGYAAGTDLEPIRPEPLPILASIAPIR